MSSALSSGSIWSTAFVQSGSRSSWTPPADYAMILPGAVGVSCMGAWAEMTSRRNR